MPRVITKLRHVNLIMFMTLLTAILGTIGKTKQRARLVGYAHSKIFLSKSSLTPSRQANSDVTE